MSIVKRSLYMTTIVSSLVDRVVKDFRFHDTPDVLRIPISIGDTTIEFSHIVPSWGPGVVVEIGSELILVLTVDENSHSANVVRGWLNTTAEAHAENSPIFLAPRIFRGDVINLINDCLMDIYPRVFAVGQTELMDYNSRSIGYALPNDVGDILSVYGEMNGRAEEWTPLADWEYIGNTAIESFTSERALMLRVSMPSNARLVVNYSRPFGKVANENYDLEAVEVGMRPYMVDLPFYYAMSRLMVDEEKARSQIDSAQAHQRSADVPAFLALRTGEWYKARYEERLIRCMETQRYEAPRLRLAGYGS